VSSTTVSGGDPRRRGRSPFGATLRGRARELLVACLLGTLATYALLAALGAPALEAAIPHGALRGDGPTPAVIVGSPTTSHLLRAECALLGGVALSLAAAVGYAGHDDDRVDLSRCVGPLVVAAGLFVAGAVVGRLLVVPASVDLLLSGFGSGSGRRTVADARWLAELGLFVPASVGVGAALPALVVGAVRGRLLPRYTGSRARGLAALALLAFASVYSPPDLPTFALVAAPPFAGFAAGIAWLELR
jgi:hypothetical protein